MLKKYYLHIIVVLILILVVSTIVFYFYCNNKKQAMQKTIDSVLNKEPQREFYTILSGPKYFNKIYGFSMNIPSDRYILEEKFSNSAGDNISLIDETFKDNFRDSLLKNEPSGGGVYFAMSITPKLDESSLNLKGNIDELEQMFKKGFVEKTEFLINGNKKVSFYLISKKNEAWPASLDKFLPEATAFFEDKGNAYYFLSMSYYDDSIEERQSYINIMEEAIKSIKFNN